MRWKVALDVSDISSDAEINRMVTAYMIDHLSELTGDEYILIGRRLWIGGT
jgi:hypothetical protein